MSHCTFYREREDGNYDYVKKNLDDDTEVVIRVMTPTEYEESQRPNPEVAAEDNRLLEILILKKQIGGVYLIEPQQQQS